MKTVVSLPTLEAPSWSNDLTASETVKRHFLYVQCLGHYRTNSGYAVRNRRKLHSHLFLYTLQGSGILEYADRSLLLTPGTLVLIDCEQIHSYYNSSKELWDFEWIHFSGGCIDGYLDEIARNWDKIELCHAQNRMEEIMKYCEDAGHEHDISCSTALIHLCSDYLLSLKKTLGNSVSAYYPFVKDAMDYLQENFATDVSLDFLCRRLHISKSYLGHAFKEQLGESPYEYLINQRLSFAKSLLRSTNQSVAAIAEQGGFYSSSYFIQVFKKRENLTPLQYRQAFLQLYSD